MAKISSEGEKKKGHNADCKTSHCSISWIYQMWRIYKVTVSSLLTPSKSLKNSGPGKCSQHMDPWGAVPLQPKAGCMWNMGCCRRLVRAAADPDCGFCPTAVWAIIPITSGTNFMFNRQRSKNNRIHSVQVQWATDPVKTTVKDECACLSWSLLVFSQACGFKCLCVWNCV